MAQAYSPGLTVTESIVLRKDRILPLKGKVLVKKGDKVKSDDFVAETLLPGKVIPFNLANKLGVDPKFMKDYVKIKEGDILKKLPLLGTKTAKELSLAAVSAFRTDALAAGLSLPS